MKRQKHTLLLDEYSLILSLLVAAILLLEQISFSSSSVRRLSFHLLRLFKSIYKFRESNFYKIILTIYISSMKCYFKVSILFTYTLISLPLKSITSLFPSEKEEPSNIWIVFARTCDCIFTIDCNLLRVVTACRRTSMPLIVA